MYQRIRLSHRSLWLLPILPAILALFLGLRPPTPAHAAAGPAGKIAFTSDRGGNNDIWVMDADGSNLVQLTTDPGSDGWPIWSPDGRRIAFHSDRSGNSDIWVMNADGSGQTNLTSTAGTDRVPTWSPDGTQLAFWSDRSGNGDIWTMDDEGGNQTQVTTDTGGDFSPDWSPDGARITFFSLRDGHSEIYAIAPDGTGETRLTFSAAGFEAANGVYSPDGLKIAFAINSTSAPFNGNLYVMKADGSNIQQVTTFSAPDDAVAPQWSPDGTKLIYTGYPDGGGLQDIYRINADGSGAIENLTSLGTADDALADQQPPVGGKIAFTSDRSGNEDIWLMDGDGSNPVQLTTDPGSDRWPIWSPDGTKIAFHSNRSGNWDIWVMNADGSGQTNLTNNAASDRVATWSPDGTQLAFWSDRSGNADIWIMDADGSNPTQVTTDVSGDFSPDWSPDGTKITFYSLRDGQAEIYAINPDGSGETRLTFSAPGFEASNGVYSPDGTKIAFVISDTTSPFPGNLYVMNADGSGIQQVTFFTLPDDGFVPQWTPDGKQLLYTGQPDGGGLQDIYVTNADGSGATANLTRLDTAYDFYADQQPLAQVFVSTTTAGTVGDVTFGPHDILKWDGSAWSKAFDGTAAGLTPSGNAKHDINASWLDYALESWVMSFTQNARVVPGIAGKVDGMDLVKWDGSAFSLYFDGSDVGLTNKTEEKIDALHVLPGSLSPIGGNCQAYLLISTQGPGRVPAYGGGQIRFSGEDVLGFCLTNSGQNTTGFWHLVLDGSAEGMPRNSLDSLSAAAGGSVLYLTTKGVFTVDSASGGHSMVYRYDMATGEFSGPTFSAPAEGLAQKVDALQVEGMLP